MTLTRRQVGGILALFAVVIAILAVRTVQLGQQLHDLRADVHAACAGRVAALDLTEWVQVCLNVQD